MFVLSENLAFCFLVTSVLRFAFLPYYRRIIIILLCLLILKIFFPTVFTEIETETRIAETFSIAYLPHNNFQLRMRITSFFVEGYKHLV